MNTDQLIDWKSRAEAAEKACAEMRAIFTWMWEEGEMGYIECKGSPRECGSCGSIGAHSIHCFQGRVEKALSLDVGRDYFQFEEKRKIESNLISAKVILKSLVQSLNDLQSVLDTHSRQSDSKDHETLPT